MTTTNGTSTLAILDGDAELSATANGINLTNLDISAKNASSTVTFLADTNIGKLTAQADKGSNLVIGTAGATTSLVIGESNSTLGSVSLEGTKATLQLDKGSLTINTVPTNL